MYEDETQCDIFLQENLYPTPDVEDQCLGAEIMLSRGNQMDSGHVIACKCNARKNVMGRSYANSILNTRLYQGEFPEGR